MYETPYIIVYHKEKDPGKCKMDRISGYHHHSVPNVPNYEYYDVDEAGDLHISGKIMRDIASMSDEKQLLFGIGTGFILGYTLTKFGKFVCIAFGSGVIVLQLAQQNDYIKFNLVRALGGEAHEDYVNDPRRHRSSTSQQVRPGPVFNINGWLVSVRRYLLQQPNLSSGCIGGFLLGLGLS